MRNLTMVRTKSGRSNPVSDKPSNSNNDRSRSPSRENHVSDMREPNNSAITGNVQSNNIFNSLQMDIANPQYSTTNRPRGPIKEVKLPPFVIKNKSIANINAILKSVTTDKKQVSVLLTKDGTKIYLQNEEHYRLLRTMCDDINKEYSATDIRRINYTAHPLSDEKVR